MRLNWNRKKKKYADPIKELIADLVERSRDHHIPFEFKASFPDKLSEAIARAGRQLSSGEIKILTRMLFLSWTELVAGVSSVIKSNEIINYSVKKHIFSRFYNEGPVPFSYFDNLLDLLELCRKISIEADSELLRQLARKLIRRAFSETKVIRYGKFMGETRADSDDDEWYFRCAARAVKLCPEQEIINKFIIAYAKRGNLGTKITVYPGTSDKNVGGYGHQRHYELVTEIVKLGASREAIEKLIGAFKKVGNEQAINFLTESE